jgi:release factor glutamine methyltransferase
VDVKTTLARRLEAGGFIAPAEEAEALLAAAGGDGSRLNALVSRRLTGEPLAWITGRASFCGAEIRVDPGVYVPRWHTEELALRAAHRCPPTGIVADLCTGSGAIAATIGRLRPGARVVAADIDERAVSCAKANGVEAYHGDLFAALPAEFQGLIDVLVAVVPYVPSAELQYLQRDALTFEGSLPYVGGADGADILRRVVADSAQWLHEGSALLLELGGVQAELLREDLARHGYAAVTVLRDEDGDVRGVEAAYGNRA